MLKPFNKSDFKPAVLDPSTGKTYTGSDHLEAIQTAEADGIHYLGKENTGFLKTDGTFYTRSQTEKEYGFKTSEDLLENVGRMNKKTFRKEDFLAAVKDPETGQIWTGEEHREAINKAHNSGNKNVRLEDTGFLKSDGTFLTRAQTKEEYGFDDSSALR
jgi:fructose-1,6-bisphosphatase/inositol monophosphatase family enzyme